MTTSQSELEEELKQLIIDTLFLEEMTCDDINSDAPLFGDGLGLDSIDALELGIALEKRYGIKLKSDSEENKTHFASVYHLGQLVLTQRTK